MMDRFKIGILAFSALLLAGCQTTYWGAMEPYDKALLDTAGKYNGTYYLRSKTAVCPSGRSGTSGIRALMKNGVVSGSHTGDPQGKALKGKVYADGTVKAKGYLYRHRTGIDKYTFLDGKIRDRVLHAKVDQGLIENSGRGNTLEDNYAQCDHGTYQLKKVS